MSVNLPSGGAPPQPFRRSSANITMMPLGPRDVAQLVDVLTGRDTAQRQATVTRGNAQGLVDVVDGEGHAMHADLVRKSRCRLDRRGVDVLEEFDLASTIRGLQHGDPGVVAVQPHRRVGPLTADGVLPHQREAEIREECDRGVQVANGDADVFEPDVHAPDATRPGCSRGADDLRRVR